MNRTEFRLSAFFEKVPSNEEQKAIEAELRGFLSCFVPHESIIVRTKLGSWEIILIGCGAATGLWLLRETGKFMLNKKLDEWYNSTSQLPPKETISDLDITNTMVSVPEKENNMATEIISDMDIIPSLPSNSIYEPLCQYLMFLKKKCNMSKIDFDHWDGVQMRGVAISVKEDANGEDGVSISVFSTKNDLDSFREQFK